MSKLRTPIIYALAICLASCGEPRNTPSSTQKQATVNHNDTINLYCAIDTTLMLYYTEALHGVPLSITKRTPVRIISKTAVYLMEASAVQLPFLLHPGNSYSFSLQGNRLQLSNLTGTHDPELNFLKDLTYETGSIRNLVSNTYLPDLNSLTSRDSMIEAKYEQRLNYMYAHDSTYKLSKSFKSYCTNLFKFSRVYEKLSLYYKTFDKTKLFNFYRDSMAAFAQALDCDTCIDMVQYRDATLRYLRFFAYHNERRQHSPQFGLDGLTPGQLQTLLSFVDGIPSASGFLTANVISGLIVNGPEKVDSSFLIKQILSLPDEVFRTELTNSLNDFYEGSSQPANVGRQELYARNGDVVTFEEVLDKNKGKVIVLDFWASWCQPCISEIPASLELQATLADLSVVFISIDKSPELWKKREASLSIAGHSYRANGSDHSAICRYFNINVIPRYILIGKDGKVRNTDAPMPSNPALARQIKSLLSD